MSRVLEEEEELGGEGFVLEERDSLTLPFFCLRIVSWSDSDRMRDGESILSTNFSYFIVIKTYLFILIHFH